MDKDKQHLQEQLAGVRSEKDALEAVLFDTANMLDDAETKRQKLEQELQDMLVAQEGYKGGTAWLILKTIQVVIEMTIHNHLKKSK